MNTVTTVLYLNQHFYFSSFNIFYEPKILTFIGTGTSTYLVWAVLRGRFSRNYLRSGAGAKFFFFIFTTVSLEDARIKKN